jgi:hypothetical protein
LANFIRDQNQYWGWHVILSPLPPASTKEGKRAAAIREVKESGWAEEGGVNSPFDSACWSAAPVIPWTHDLAEVIALLPSKLQPFARDKWEGGYAHAEIATRRGVSERTVGEKLAEAKRRTKPIVRRMVDNYYSFLEE